MSTLRMKQRTTAPSAPASGYDTLYVDSADTLRILDAAGNDKAVRTDPAPEALFTEEYASGTAGATLTGGAWNTRALNTTKYNDISGVSLNATTGEITLPAGTYEVRAYLYATRDPATGAYAYQQMARVRDVTNAVTLASGTSGFSSAYDMGISVIQARFTVSGTVTVRLEHYSNTNGTSGRAASSGENEQYAWIKLTRL